MDKYLEMISVPAIAATVFWVLYIVKKTVNSDKLDRWIPLIAAGLGMIFGVIAFFAIPSIIPAENVVVAIVIGGASGLTATGAHQIYKQLEKKDE